MTAFRRAALGLLTVLLLAVTALAVGYAVRQPTGPDIGAGAGLPGDPSPVGHQPRDETTPPRTPVATPEPAVDTVAPTPPTEAPSPTEAPTAAQTPDPTSTPTPVPTIAPGPALLQQGDEGDQVRELQARLKQIAWFYGDVTGTYGDITAEAVRGFQAKRGIPVTGEVDQRTTDRLEAMTTEPSQEALHNLIESNQPGPLDARCETGRVLCIDKSSRTLRWVVDGQVLRTVDVRFGASYTPTREGTFAVEWKSRDHVSSLYDSEMPFAMFFSGGQAVHYSSDFATRGYSGASHGCVNVRDRDAIAALYDEVQVGDRVVVYWS